MQHNREISIASGIILLAAAFLIFLSYSNATIGIVFLAIAVIFIVNSGRPRPPASLAKTT